MKGFLTVEIVIAMALISLLLGAVILTSFGNQHFLTGGATDSGALSQAESLLETAGSLARQDFRAVNPVATTTNSIYKEWLAVGPSSSTTDYFSKQVTAYVSWVDENHLTQLVKLSSLVTNFQNVAGGSTCNSFLSGNWMAPIVHSLDFNSLISNDTSGSYPITSLDVYNGRMFVAVNSASVTVGPQNPSVGTSGAISGAGAVVWNSPNNVLTNNGSSAVSGTTLNSGNSTQYLRASNFGFNIPLGATILGIKVEIERSRNTTSSGNIFDSHVRLVRSDGTAGTNDEAATATAWPSTEAYATYGSQTDLWGDKWAASDINNANFGAIISATGSSGGGRLAQVDHIRVTVTYVRQLYQLSTSNPIAPVRSSEIVTLPGVTPVSTGFNEIVTDGNYVYAATNAGPATGQLQIILATTTPMQTTETYPVPSVTGTGSQALGQSVFYSNGYIYLGLTKTASGPEFNIIDVHNPNAPSLIGSFAVGAGIEDIYVRGNYAYLATDDNTRELLILDISNPSAPKQVGIYNASGSTGFGLGHTLDLAGSTLLLGRTYDPSGSEYLALDASNTPNVLLKNSKDVGPNSSNAFSVGGVLVRDYLAFVLTGGGAGGTKGGQLQIINATSTAQYANSIALPNGSSGQGGTAIECEGNYVFLGSVDSSSNGWLTIVNAN
jgi:LVIVD repeat